MTMKRALVDLLDRPGGRRILAQIAAHIARRATGGDAGIFYDGQLWVHRVGQWFFPTDRRFRYFASSFHEWRALPATYLANTEEYWYRHGRPQLGDTVFDIGAGRGEDTLSFSRAVGAAGRVIAIEAHPASYELLEAFCRYNHLTNVIPLHLAVMDEPGHTSMVESPDWRGHAIQIQGSPTAIRVPADTLDRICESHNIQYIDFLKMNIEGAEKFALLGASRMICQTRSLCIACHDFLADRGLGEHYRTREFVERFLVDRGFQVHAEQDDPRDFIRCHLFASPAITY